MSGIVCLSRPASLSPIVCPSGTANLSPIVCLSWPANLSPMGFCQRSPGASLGLPRGDPEVPRGSRGAPGFSRVPSTRLILPVVKCLSQRLSQTRFWTTLGPHWGANTPTALVIPVFRVFAECLAFVWWTPTNGYSHRLVATLGSHRGNIGVTLVPRWGHIGPPWGHIGRQNFHCIDNVVFVWGFFSGPW